MSMTESQRAAVVALTPIQALLAWVDLHRVRPEFPAPRLPDPQKAEPNDIPNGAELMTVCSAYNLDQADIVLPMCKRTHREAVAALETLIGHPITRLQPKGKARPPRAPRISGQIHTSSRALSDPRVIVAVQPNPKKPGSASYDRYALYKEGLTVAEVCALGVSSGDIKWDTERGFITLKG